MTAGTKHTCPRRSEIGQRYVEGQDQYTEGHGVIGQSRGCSYCGSMSPDDVMAGIRSGEIVLGPTDKSYKVYIDQPVTDEDAAERKRRWLASDPVAEAIRGAVSEDGGDVESALEAQWENVRSVHLQGKTVGKFYYQHLSDEQRREFIDLLNEKRVRWGYPGYPYVLPYFVQTVPRTEVAP